MKSRGKIIQKPIQDFRGTMTDSSKKIIENPGSEDVILKLVGNTIDSVWNIKAVDTKDLREKESATQHKNRKNFLKG